MSDMKQTLEIIQELMDDLQEKMEPSADDFNERLGKPKIDVLKIEGKLNEEPEESPMREAMPGDMEEDMMEEEMPSPEDELKNRLMKLRGK
jgi:hypothetical protein